MRLNPQTTKRKGGKRKNEALRMTMRALSKIFYAYNLKSDNVEENHRYFISSSLDAANISHPDPYYQKKKFDNLLRRHKK